MNTALLSTPVPATAPADEAGLAGIVCIAENRGWCEPGVRLLIASLARHSPGMAIHLFFPDPSPGLTAFLTGHPNVAVNLHPLAGEWRNYDIKPTAMLALLDAGHDDVIWVDSDIIVRRDIRGLFGRLPATLILATEEALGSNHGDMDAQRTRLWGMEVGRALPFTANTGVIRLTAIHRPLLVEWATLLGTDGYRQAQRAPWNERPPHLLGDQEVFTALLGSRAFAHFPVRLLRRGRDIVQFFGSTGYTVRERLGHLRRPPAFIHAQGRKPWAATRPDPQSASARFLNAYADLSPYTVAARAYAGILDDARWTRPRTIASRLFDALGGGFGPLVGLPHAAIADAISAVRSFAARRRA